MRLAAENLSMSCMENSWTRSNCLSRRVLPRDAAMLVAQNPAATENPRLRNAHRTMSVPYSFTTSVPLPVWMAYVMSFI